MACLGISWVGIDGGSRLALPEELLQTEKVTVNPLSVSGPRSVLQMASGSAAEKISTVFILTKIKQNVGGSEYVYVSRWHIRWFEDPPLHQQRP